jgi:hypothetical protein
MVISRQLHRNWIGGGVWKGEVNVLIAAFTSHWGHLVLHRQSRAQLSGHKKNQSKLIREVT